MFHLAIILLGVLVSPFGVLASPSDRIGGEAGFHQHLENLQRVFAASPSGNTAYRIAVGYASRGRLADAKTWLVKKVFRRQAFLVKPMPGQTSADNFLLPKGFGLFGFAKMCCQTNCLNYN